MNRRSAGWLVFTAAVLGMAACSADTLAVPSAPDMQVRKSLSDGLTVLNVQLRPIDASTSEAYGHLQFKFLPPSPISPPPLSVAISGHIFNPGGETLSGDDGFYTSLSLTDGGGLISAFDIGLPPNPIKNFNVDMTTSIPSDFATSLVTSPQSYIVRVGNLVGIFR